MKTKKDIYYIKEETPLKYYYFIIITSYIGAVAAFTYAVIEIINGQLLVAVLEALFCCLTLTAAIGLSSMKWYGVIAFYIEYCVSFLLNEINIFLDTSLDNASIIGQATGTAFGTLIWIVPSIIYFNKRKPLFCNKTKKNKEKQNEDCNSGEMKIESYTFENSITNSIDYEHDNINSRDDNKIRYCKKCGFKLIENSKYCSNCGNKIQEI